MAFSVSTLAFMPILGISMACSILVGQHLGENRDDLAERATWTALTIAVAYMLLISILYLAIPGILLYGFFAGASDVGGTVAVQAMARRLLRFVAAYNLFDAVLMTMVGAIKGAGDTVYVLWVSLAMAAALAGFTWLSVEGLQLGIYASWTVITAWVWTGGVVYLHRFRGGAWRSMRVIRDLVGWVFPPLRPGAEPGDGLRTSISWVSLVVIDAVNPQQVDVIEAAGERAIHRTRGQIEPDQRGPQSLQQARMELSAAAGYFRSHRAVALGTSRWTSSVGWSRGIGET